MVEYFDIDFYCFEGNEVVVEFFCMVNVSLGIQRVVFEVCEFFVVGFNVVVFVDVMVMVDGKDWGVFGKQFVGLGFMVIWLCICEGCIVCYMDFVDFDLVIWGFEWMVLEFQWS